MFRTILLLCMAAVVSGCASLSYPLPKCDGYSRRPLNRALWQWEGNSSLPQEHSDAGRAATPLEATAYVEEVRGPSAFAQFDVETSYPACEA